MNDLNQLLELTAHKDQAAFKRLYDQTSPRLFSIAKRIMERESLAEEVLQEAYIKIWDKAERYNSSKGHALAWMTVITRNTALDTLKSLSVRPEEVETVYEGSPYVASDINLSPENRIDYLKQLKQTDERLNALQAEQKQCIIFSHFYGYSHQELSEILEKPLGTIKSWIRRGNSQILAE